MSTIKFYCMSLNSRQDRRLKVSSEFQRLDIPIKWWIVKRHPEGGNYGCFESHVNIWEKNDADIAIIFEDDFEFKGTPQEFWEIINEAIQLLDKCDTIHLGNITYNLGQRVSKNFYKGNFLTASSYLSRKDKLKKLIPIAKEYYGTQIDIVLSQISNQLGLFPCKVFQDFTDSNNGWTKFIPIISKIPNIEKGVRNELTNNPYYLLKYPYILNEGGIKFMVVLNCIQQVLPQLLYNTGVEYTDRRF